MSDEVEEKSEGTSIEIGGVKFTGGKMFAIATALSAGIGTLYGGFEVYKDYMDMKQQIQEYEKQAELAKNAQEQLKLALAEKQKQKDKVITRIVTQVKEVQTTPACDSESKDIYEKIRGQVEEFNAK